MIISFKNQIVILILMALLVSMLINNHKALAEDAPDLVWSKYQGYSEYIDMNGRKYGRDIASDQDGNVYAAMNHQLYLSPGAWGIRNDIIKYDKDGNVIWEAEQNPSKISNYIEWHGGGVSSIALDASRNVYVSFQVIEGSAAIFGTGTGVIKSSGYDLNKISSSGQLIFSKYIPSKTYTIINNVLTNVSSNTKNMDVDASGNIYLSGIDLATYKGFLKKFDTNGNLLWTIYDPSLNVDGSVVISNDGIINWSFNRALPGEGQKIKINKINSAGSIVKEIILPDRYVGLGINRMVSDANGNLYLSVYNGDRASYHNIYKINNSGNLVWNINNDYGSYGTDIGGLSLDSDNNLYSIASGYTNSRGLAPYTQVIRKFNADGVNLWNKEYTDGVSWGVIPGGITINNNGIFTNATSYASTEGNIRALTQRYVQPTTPVIPEAPIVTLKANDTEGILSIDYNTAANLTWTSQNADNCSAQGDWNGDKDLNNSIGESTGNLTSDKFYRLICTGPGGSTNKSVIVQVNAAPNLGKLTIKGDVFAEKDITGINVDQNSVIVTKNDSNVTGSQWQINKYNPTELLQLGKFIEKMSVTVERLTNEYATKINDQEAQFNTGAIYLNTISNNINTPTDNINIKPEGRVWVVDNGRVLIINKSTTVYGIGTIILKSGNLLINQNINYNDNKSSIGFIVLDGNIEIGSGVTSLRGAYYVPNGNIIFK